MTKRRTRGVSDLWAALAPYLRLYRQQVILISCGAVIAAAGAFAAYLLYSSSPVEQPLPDARPLPIAQPDSSGPAEAPEQPIAGAPSGQQTAPAETPRVPPEETVPEPPAVQPPTLPEARETAPATAVAQPAPKPAVHAPVAQLPPEPAEPPRDAADYYLYTAHACEAAGDFANALGWYKKALPFDPKGFRLLNKIAFVLMRMELYDEAAVYAERALAAQGDYIPALVNLGIIRARQERQEDAQRLFEQVLSFDNTNTAALYNMMLLSKQRGDYKRAGDIERKLRALGYPARP